MPDEDSQDRLRIGGWVPPYRDANGPLPPPVPPRRSLPANLWTFTGPRHTDGVRGRRAGVALATGAVIAVVGLVVLSLRGDPGESSLSQRMVVAPVVPTDPVSVLPSPTTTTTSRPAKVTPSPSPTGSRVPAARPSGQRTTTPSTRPPTTPPAVTLTPGAKVGLALAVDPQYRLRHRDSLAHFDRVEAGSPRADRLDARFAVRRGLARDECVTLESGNRPGFFLRHRDFVLRLERRDGSRLFDQDATFCARRSGGTLALESVNYPGHFLSVRQDGVRLTRDDPTAFAVKAPL